jgi:hypothetical protein
MRSGLISQQFAAAREIRICRAAREGSRLHTPIEQPLVRDWQQRISVMDRAPQSSSVGSGRLGRTIDRVPMHAYVISLMPYIPMHRTPALVLFHFSPTDHHALTLKLPSASPATAHSTISKNNRVEVRKDELVLERAADDVLHEALHAAHVLEQMALRLSDLALDVDDR